MSNEKPLKLDMSFEEALRRLAQTDPEKIADAIEENKKRADDIRSSAAERRDRLRAAIKGPKRPSRP